MDTPPPQSPPAPCCIMPATPSRAQLDHIDSIRFYERADCLQLDQVTVRNLELVDTLFSDGDARRNALPLARPLPHAMGKRMLRSSLLRPLARRPKSFKNATTPLASCTHDLIRRENLRAALDGILDLERLLGRISLDTRRPRDLLALGVSFASCPKLQPGARTSDIPALERLPGAASTLSRTCSPSRTNALFPNRR